MASQHYSKSVSTNAAKILTEIWSHTNVTSQNNILTTVLGIESGSIPTDENQKKLKFMSGANSITYNHLMSMIDTSITGWQAKMAFICETAKAQSNANKLDELTRLTLLSLECRPLTIQPPIYDSKVHHNYKNYIRTVWHFWHDGQGLSQTQSIKHLPLSFANNELMRDHIYTLV